MKLLTIALLYLKTTYTSRSTFLFSILMPLLFTFVLGQAMEGLGPEDAPASWPLPVVDEDGSPWSANLIARLEADPLLEVQISPRETAREAVEAGEAPAALTIPAGFGDALQRGDSVTLTFRQNPEQISTAQLLQESVAAATAELSASLAVADFSLRVADQVGVTSAVGDSARAAYRQQAFERAETAWAAGAPVVVAAQPVTRLESGPDIPIGASQSSPGMLVMYALFFTFGGGASLLVERDEGTLRRLLVMPVGKGTILGGKLAGIFLGALVQMAIMVLAGQFAFGVNWGQAPLALAAMLLAYGFAGTALGLMVAALARTVAQANAAGTISIMALASLGGAWWPIEIVPAWMQTLAKALPTYWGMQGFHDIVTRGLGVQAVLPEVGVLLGFGMLFLGVGVWRFRYE